MVSLTRHLLKWRPSKVDITLYTRDQICRGPDAIKDLLPLTVMNEKKPPKKPDRGEKSLFESFVLGRTFRVRATKGLKIQVERAGGFDRYIYYTPDEDLKSQLARSLKLRMMERTEKYPQTVPPPLSKRNPQPVPRNLSKGLEPVEVCSMNKFIDLLHGCAKLNSKLAHLC